MGQAITGISILLSILDRIQTAGIQQDRTSREDRARGLIGDIPDASFPGFRLGDFESPPIGPQAERRFLGSFGPGAVGEEEAIARNAGIGRSGDNVIDFTPAFSNTDIEAAIREGVGLDGSPFGGPVAGSALQRDTDNIDLNALLRQFSDPTFDPSRFDEFLKTFPGREADAQTRFDEGILRNEGNLQAGLGGLADIRRTGQAGLEEGRITDFQKNIDLLKLADPEAIFRNRLAAGTESALRTEQGSLDRGGQRFSSLAATGRDPFNIASSGIASRESALNQRLGSIQAARTDADTLRSTALGANSDLISGSIGQDLERNTAIDDAITSLLNQESVGQTNLRQTQGTADASLAGGLEIALANLGTLEGQALGAREEFATAGQEAQTGLEADLMSFLANIPGAASGIEQGQLQTAAGAFDVFGQQGLQAQAFDLQKALAAAGFETTFQEVVQVLQDQFASAVSLVSEDAPMSTLPPLSIGSPGR